MRPSDTLRGSGRKPIPYEPDEPTGVEDALAKNNLLDPRATVFMEEKSPDAVPTAGLHRVTRACVNYQIEPKTGHPS